jgi:hypothetical protein
MIAEDGFAPFFDFWQRIFYAAKGKQQLKFDQYCTESLGAGLSQRGGHAGAFKRFGRPRRGLCRSGRNCLVRAAAVSRASSGPVLIALPGIPFGPRRASTMCKRRYRRGHPLYRVGSHTGMSGPSPSPGRWGSPAFRSAGPVGACPAYCCLVIARTPPQRWVRHNAFAIARTVERRDAPCNSKRKLRRPGRCVGPLRCQPYRASG